MRLLNTRFLLYFNMECISVITQQTFLFHVELCTHTMKNIGWRSLRVRVYLRAKFGADDYYYHINVDEDIIDNSGEHITDNGEINRRILEHLIQC